MTEEVNFVSDLAVILIAAGLCTIISRALKQPAILGYIIAGFIIGPEMGVFGISNTETVKLWSDIGIIFLMFGLGLEFSFKKLLKAGRASLATAGSKFLGVFVIGYMVGKALMWTTMESIFLAGLLSMSSTMVVVKSYGEMGLGKKSYAPAVFGTLVFEDLIAILLMVLLSTLAVSNKFSGGEMLLNLGKLLFFIILWFLLGIYLIPTILKKTGKYLNDEILLIVSLGLCFGMVALATRSGFSSALGAFMMGSILAETVESEHIDKLTSPIKDLFGAIFFVSVGMMLAPQTVIQYWWLILVLAVVVVLTHVLFASFGIILSGGGLNDALHTGFSLAQLGEFGFIIAGVGVSLGVKSGFKLRQREQDIAQLERENMRRQLESLHFQINPHFFMNTMNNIQALILTDPEKAAESIEQLSDMMRITLSNGSSTVVPLADEICFLQDYVALMRLRYSERVSIETVFPGETGDAVVPPLAIATLMENAFKHGIRSDADSFVRLEIELSGGGDRRIICRCCNSLPGEKGSAGLGIGLDNVRQRLVLIYGERFSLINEPAGGQYVVRLEIPAVA